MQTTGAAVAPRQADVEGFSLKLSLQFGIGQCLTACIQCRFNCLFGQIDGRAPAFLFFNRQGGHALHQLGNAACFTQKQCLGVFQTSGRDSACEGRCSAVNH